MMIDAKKAIMLIISEYNEEVELAEKIKFKYRLQGILRKHSRVLIKEDTYEAKMLLTRLQNEIAKQ